MLINFLLWSLAYRGKLVSLYRFIQQKMFLSRCQLISLLKHIISFLLIFSISVNLSLPVVSRQTSTGRSAVTLVDSASHQRDHTSLYRFATSLFQKGIPFFIVFIKQSLAFESQVSVWRKAQSAVRLKIVGLFTTTLSLIPIYSSERKNSTLYIG